VFTRGEKRTLRGHRFQDIDLDRVDFSDADLRKTRFERVSLRACDFSRADLRGALFLHCDLRGALFVGARFGKNHFTGSRLVRSPKIAAAQQKEITEAGGLFSAIPTERSSPRPHKKPTKLRALD